MEIKKPVFTLKNFCPICEQGGSLVFCSCPKCGTIIIICSEELSIFLNPKNICKEAALQTSCENILCPGCGQITIDKFPPSTGEEIQKAGFSLDEYE